MTNSVITTAANVPVDSGPTNRDHNKGQVMAEKMPASAAETGVGEMFNARASS